MSNDYVGNIVSVAFACNDPGNGMPTGTFDGVHIGNALLNLESQYWPPKEFAFSIKINETTQHGGFAAARVKGHVKVSRRRFEIIGYKYGWGNWCWDLVIMRPQVALELINYLKSLNAFTCECGQSDFFDTFNEEGKMFTDEHLPALKEWGYSRP